jgi:HK97 gp10 family phage protein
VSGGGEFARFATALRVAAGGIEAKGRKAVQRVAEDTKGTAQANAPVLTGALRSGLRVSSRSGELRAVVETTTFYGYFQEYGTSRMAPNPFMGPAVERHAPELVAAIEEIRDEMAREL